MKTRLINSKTVFAATLIVIPAVALIVYLSGLQQHRSLYLNSLISTSILSVIFLSFISIGLYRGWKQLDTLGNITNKFKVWEKHKEGLGPVMPEIPIAEAFDSINDLPGCLLSIIIWIIVGLAGSFILWFFGAFVWIIILGITAMLYWIIFRAYRLILLNAPKCKGNLLKSFGIAVFYTFLYNCWIYGIIFLTHFWIDL